MKRMTERDEFGNADIIGVDSCDWMPHVDGSQLNYITFALNRLALYEDTDLLPKQIRELQELKEKYRQLIIAVQNQAVSFHEEGPFDEQEALKRVMQIFELTEEVV